MIIMEQWTIGKLGPRLKKVNTFNFYVTTNTEMSLELLSKTIRKARQMEGPSVGKDMHPRFVWNKLPSVEVRFEGYFSLHGIPPFSA